MIGLSEHIKNRRFVDSEKDGKLQYTRTNNALDISHSTHQPNLFKSFH